MSPMDLAWKILKQDEFTPEQQQKIEQYQQMGMDAYLPMLMDGFRQENAMAQNMPQAPQPTAMSNRYQQRLDTKQAERDLAAKARRALKDGDVTLARKLNREYMQTYGKNIIRMPKSYRGAD